MSNSHILCVRNVDSSNDPTSSNVSSIVAPNHRYTRTASYSSVVSSSIVAPIQQYPTTPTKKPIPQQLLNNQTTVASPSRRAKSTKIDLHGYNLDNAKRFVDESFNSWMADPTKKRMTIITGLSFSFFTVNLFCLFIL